MKYTWIALCQRSSPIHTLFLHVSTLACCTVGVAAGLKDSQLHSGGPREGGQLYWLLQRGGQTIPHIRGWWPSGQNLGLSGIEMNQREQVTVCFKHFIHEQPGKLYWSLLFRSDTKDFLVLYFSILSFLLWSIHHHPTALYSQQPQMFWADEHCSIHY